MHELSLLTISNKPSQKFCRFFHFKEICYEGYKYCSNHLLHSVAEQNLQIVSKDNHVRRHLFFKFFFKIFNFFLYTFGMLSTYITKI